MHDIFSHIYAHIVWATHLRRPSIAPSIEPQLHELMAARCLQLGAKPVAINGMSDHVHLLVSLSPRTEIARMVGILKGASSHAINHGLLPDRSFRWQRGYAVFSVDPSSVSDIATYIEHQKFHHAHGGRGQPQQEP